MRSGTLEPQPPLPFAAAAAYQETVLGWWQQERSLRPAALSFSYGADPAQRYDVYAPEGVRDAPILVFWHGGGWTNGYKEYVWFMAEHVNRLGLILVAPGYRLAPGHKLDQSFCDALAAVRDVKNRAASFGGRPDCLVLAGHSAGAHLAALLALRREAAAQSGIDLSQIRGCLPISGIMDLHHPDPAPGSMEERVYSLVLRDRDEDATLSPIHWTAGNTMPIWLSHGEFDSERVLRSNERMAALLALQPASSRLDSERGRDHFATHTDLRDGSAAWYGRLEAMVREFGA